MAQGSSSGKDRVFSLEHVRTDGWFERLGDGAPAFTQLCEVVGERFVAFAVVGGVRITSVTVDPRSEENTTIDFVVGESTDEQRLTLGEFRRRLGAALLGEEAPSPVPDDNGGLDQIQAYLGYRYVLLAPVFGMRLLELRLPAEGDPSISLELEGLVTDVSLLEFRGAIREKIRAEVARSRVSAPFSIDLNAIPRAEAALKEGDHERTIELLAGWPGPLSMLLRTPEGHQLAPDVKSTLARALGVLGTAYVKQERFDWAEEVLRLGIQWGQDSAAAAELFRRLGEACIARGRHGEAIGMLRRSLSLGALGRDVLPQLAECYAERGRWVACAVCLDEAFALGDLGEQAEKWAELRQKAVGILGPAYQQFRERVPIAGSASVTIPAPARIE